MVRYSKEHKDSTRKTVLREAARLFREKGYNGVGIDAIMREAGLTRGGFYNHFASKKALFAEVIQWDKDFVDRMRARDQERLAEGALEVATDYLSPGNRGAVGAGCPFITLTSDVVRVGDAASAAFTETVQALAHEFERGLPNAEEDDERALVAMALCVGGLLLARGTDGTPLSDKISEACQRAVKDALGS